ncbi:aldehyde dehydrogenase family protein [Achromobacter xylosoxidans]
MKKQLTTISPIDGSLYVQRDLATDTQIAQALTHAHAVQKDWARQPIAHRIRILSTAIDRFVANKEIIAEGITRQMGRPIRYAGGEVDGFAARARHMLSIAEASLRSDPGAAAGRLHPLHHARTGRRGFHDRAVELPAADGGEQHRAGAGGHKRSS